MKYFLFISLIALVGCNSEPNLSCEDDNINKLVDRGEKFVVEEIEKDESTDHMHFSKFTYVKGSCRKYRQEKKDQ